MEELIISKEELVEMFEEEKIIDSGHGWMLGDNIVEIVALHDVDPKFLQDITNAKVYKIIVKGKK